MIQFVLVILVFILFFLYDVNQTTWHRKALLPFFLLGCILLGATTLLVMIQVSRGADLHLIYLLPAIVCLLFLTYVLFFALPFKDTYIKESGNIVYRQGAYALCRHPGFWLLSGFYLFAALAIRTHVMSELFILTTLLNLAYVLFQDRYTFMKQFKDYASYKEEVPFLLPTLKSMKTCVRTWRKN